MPKVSVIMGIYNCADTLPVAIDSIIKQTFTDWELIMCDDCSTDNTYAVAKRYADSYNNIILLHNKTNRKLAFSLNRCLEIAKGEYIARMDADDICLPERFAEQNEFLDNHPDYAVVGCAMMRFDEDGTYGELIPKEYPDKNVLKIGLPFMHPTIMMRKSVYDDLHGYTVSERTKRAQDVDLWFRFYKKNYTGYNLQKPLYMYHETRNDYKKRTRKAAWGSLKSRAYGYKMLGFPPSTYIYLLWFLFKIIIPRGMIYRIKK